MTNPDLYIEPGYFEDGYVFSPCPVVLSSGNTRVDLRGPSALSGTVRLLQPEEYSTGWQHFGFTPRAVVHTLTMQYNRMNGIERDAVDAFFDTVDFTAQEFDYTDAATGNRFPVRFQNPEISLEEAAYDLYRTQLNLWAGQTFFAPPAELTEISILLNNAHYPEPIKRTKKQPMLRMSDGTVCIYNKSTITRINRTCTLVRLSRDDLASLIAHFLSVGGTRDTWTWTDPFRAFEHTCRYASPEISWQRSTVRSSTYDCQVSIVEDTAPVSIAALIGGMAIDDNSQAVFDGEGNVVTW